MPIPVRNVQMIECDERDESLAVLLARISPLFERADDESLRVPRRVARSLTKRDSVCLNSSM